MFSFRFSSFLFVFLSFLLSPSLFSSSPLSHSHTIVSGNPELHIGPAAPRPLPKSKFFKPPPSPTGAAPAKDSCPTYPCNPATHVAFPKPNYQPTSNGCGAFGFTLPDGEFPFTPCCNVHDMCYGTCNSGRHSCDDQFKVCLRKVCEDVVPNSKDIKKHSACVKQAALYHTMAASMGCMAYSKSQEEACVCKLKPFDGNSSDAPKPPQHHHHGDDFQPKVKAPKKKSSPANDTPHHDHSHPHSRHHAESSTGSKVRSQPEEQPNLRTAKDEL